jgi:hypothetical protein
MLMTGASGQGGRRLRTAAGRQPPSLGLTSFSWIHDRYRGSDTHLQHMVVRLRLWRQGGQRSQGWWQPDLACPERVIQPEAAGLGLLHQPYKFAGVASDQRPRLHLAVVAHRSEPRNPRRSCSGPASPRTESPPNGVMHVHQRHHRRSELVMLYQLGGLKVRFPRLQPDLSALGLVAARRNRHCATRHSPWSLVHQMSPVRQGGDRPRPGHGL